MSALTVMRKVPGEISSRYGGSANKGSRAISPTKTCVASVTGLPMCCAASVSVKGIGFSRWQAGFRSSKWRRLAR